MIGLIIFLTAIFSEFSVQMYNIATQQGDFVTRIAICFIAIFSMTFLIWVNFRYIPPLKKAMANIFGMSEILDEEKRKAEKEVM
jgi:hypothetical protein